MNRFLNVYYLVPNINNVTTKSITIDGYNLYNLYQSDSYADHQVSIIFDKSGVEAYAYTFG